MQYKVLKESALQELQEAYGATVFVRFLSYPPREARSQLKMNGFTFDGRRWQAPLSDNTERIAKEMKRFNAVTEIRDSETWDLDYELGY